MATSIDESNRSTVRRTLIQPVESETRHSSPSLFHIALEDRNASITYPSGMIAPIAAANSTMRQTSAILLYQAMVVITRQLTLMKMSNRVYEKRRSASTWSHASSAASANSRTAPPPVRCALAAATVLARISGVKPCAIGNVT